MEIWKPINNYEEYYEISNFGEVRSNIKQRNLVGDKNNMGYRRVILYKPIRKRFFIHRLVATHFLETPIEENMVINHIDGNKSNNRFDNLEIITHSQNDLHAFKLGLRDVANRRMVEKIDMETGKVLEVYDSVLLASKSMGFKSTCSLWKVLSGKRKSLKNYYWKYA